MDDEVKRMVERTDSSHHSNRLSGAESHPSFRGLGQAHGNLLPFELGEKADSVDDPVVRYHSACDFD